MRLNFLIVDEATESANTLGRSLKMVFPDSRVTTINSTVPASVERDISWHKYQVMLLNSRIGQQREYQCLENFGNDPDFPATIIIADEGSDDDLDAAVKYGIHEYLLKSDLSNERLKLSVKHALKVKKANLHSRMIVSSESPTNLSPHKDLPLNKLDKYMPLNVDEFAIKGYTLKNLIGVGGMSAVYLARRDEDDQEVAIKVLRPDTFEDERHIQRFIEEYQLARHFNHSRIIKVCDQGFTDQFAYIVMEYLAGENLSLQIRRGISLIDAFRYMTDITLALQELHTANIVHRDIKPGNFQFDNENQLVLLDFGVASKIEHQGDLTAHGEAIGTPNYMSPEQVLDREIDHRSDLYAAGVIFYRMLTGRHLYKGKTAAAIMYKHAYAEIPKMPAELPNTSMIINKLLAKQPADRYQSCQELLGDLERYSPEYPLAS